MITSIADVSCTPIGPPLPKSCPPVQTQVSNTTNIRVPDRGTLRQTMSLCYHRRQYEQLPEFKKRRLIGMMEGGWSARPVARQVDCSDLIVKKC
ncbi:hypothetical protein TNCV_3542201 [Trichonephila clavipes]|uniref:Uncharacterized protein n=1 Tax=Trichonephila clavipes TaxID=2585209 RepID=A0A8X6S2I9_TRICX|nr:hypothetical protein TNCV_3542201 [Trichonephila clavipes]